LVWNSAWAQHYKYPLPHSISLTKISKQLIKTPWGQRLEVEPTNSIAWKLGERLKGKLTLWVAHTLEHTSSLEEEEGQEQGQQGGAAHIYIKLTLKSSKVLILAFISAREGVSRSTTIHWLLCILHRGTPQPCLVMEAHPLKYGVWAWGRRWSGNHLKWSPTSY
jgi:hypothetical protein